MSNQNNPDEIQKILNVFQQFEEGLVALEELQQSTLEVVSVLLLERKQLAERLVKE